MKLGNYLWTANIGDARAVVIKANSSPVQLSEDAKPSSDKYRTEIEKRGHYVASDGVGTPRVDGCIAPAQAFGDVQFGVGLSARPRVTCKEVGEGDILLLACDGLFDVTTTSDIALLINLYREHSLPLDEQAARLILQALKSHTGDNVSVLLHTLL